MKLRKKAEWITTVVEMAKVSGGEINRLMGNAESEIALIAPIPDKPELDQNLPWCSPPAYVFFELIEAASGLKPDSFLVIPTTFSPGKVVNATTEVTSAILRVLAHVDQIKLFVCIGKDPFKAFFGFGKNPPSSIYSGVPVQIREAGFKPVFAFPDCDYLTPPQQPTRRFTREYYEKLGVYKKTLTQYNRIVEKLAVILKQMKIR